jgi:type I restriction enzyme, S subunit
MSIQSETALTPKLRFPEFSGDWEEKKLGDIAAFSKGKGISKSDIDDYGSLECIRYGELYTSYNELIKDIHSKTNIAKENVNLSQIGDVLIPSSGETAIDLATASCVLKNGVAIGGDLNIIRSDIDGVFNAYYLNNSKKNSIARLSQGSSVIHLYSNHLKELKLNLPTKLEQQKIATFLTSVDTKIEQLSNKQELLGEYKKGLIQKIFSQEIRFKADDGSDYRDWEEMKLGDIGSFYRGHSYNSTNVKDEGLLVLRSSNIKNDSLVLDKDLQFVNLDCSENILLRAKDIVICMANGSKKLVGRSAMYHGNYSNKLTVGAFCSIFRTNNLLSKHLLQTVKYRKYLHILLAGTNINNLKNSELAELKFNLPSSNVEREKIVNFLSSIDSKIEQIVKQLDETKQFKKALLQQMFV